MKKLKHVEEQRGIGRQHIMDVIRKKGSIARIDIANETLVSPATVTAITSELLKVGLIEEIVPETRLQAKRGRPRVALKVRGAAYKIAGLKVARNHISVVIVDFEGNDIASKEIDLPKPSLSPQQLGERILQSIRETCASAGIAVDELAGIGIGLSGLVDSPTGVVHWSPSLDKRNVDLGSVLSPLFDCPVFIDNDANLVAKAEQLFGLGRNVSNFVVVTIEHGVGMGVVIDNEIYRGSRGCGAEFGHTKVQLEGALCQCGQRGCLEAYIGDYALLREANEAGGREPMTELSELWEAAVAGDQMASDLFKRAGRMFAMGLANAINIFDPEIVILAGRRAAFDHLDFDAVHKEMLSHVVQVDAPPTPVKVHQWGDLMWAKGAAAFAIKGVSALKIRELAVFGG